MFKVLTAKRLSAGAFPPAAGAVAAGACGVSQDRQCMARQRKSKSDHSRIRERQEPERQQFVLPV
jgi:hypothetical protein